MTLVDLDDFDAVGQAAYALAKRLFPICRSITGNGVRQTLAIVREWLPELNVHEVPTGTAAFDWEVPKEWNIRNAYVMDAAGNRIIDWKEHNLHVMGYSVRVDREMTLEELQEHLYSLPDQPDAIPYVTSYYAKRWGFCLTDNRRKQLRPGMYRVFIDSTLEPGSLTYADLLLPGESQEEVLLSTYLCHPSMANNELSGPVVTTMLVRWLLTLAKRRYSYRVVFVPETIGSIVYLSRHLDEMKRNTVAGFNISCVGDNRAYSLLHSRLGATLADRVAQCVLRHHCPDFVEYSFLARGSDERQYCSPGVDLPVVSVMRSKYGTYPEYHTSLDDLTLISPEGLSGAYDVLRQCLAALEGNYRYKVQCLCEPQLGRRGLYPTLSTRTSDTSVSTMMDFIAYCDGNHDVVEIAEKLGVPPHKLLAIAATIGNMTDNGGPTPVLLPVRQ